MVSVMNELFSPATRHTAEEVVGKQNGRIDPSVGDVGWIDLETAGCIYRSPVSEYRNPPAVSVRTDAPRSRQQHQHSNRVVGDDVITRVRRDTATGNVSSVQFGAQCRSDPHDPIDPRHTGGLLGYGRCEAGSRAPVGSRSVSPCRRRPCFPVLGSVDASRNTRSRDCPAFRSGDNGRGGSRHARRSSDGPGPGEGDGRGGGGDDDRPSG